MASTQSGRDPGGRASFLHSGPYRSWRNAAAGLAVAAILASCAAMEAGFHSKHNETLADLKFTELCAPAGAALAQPAACIDCTASIEQRLRLANGASPQYALEEICDNTDPRLLVIFAFSGGGFRSAAFGFGALQAAHEIDLDRLGPHHPLSREIDIVSGVSGGAFTATAFASRREALFDTHGGRYYGRDFLEHNFMGDLLSVYLEPWRWGWMLPYYGTTDEMASLYGDIPFDDRTALFGENFGTLAVKGRPFLVVQATDFGNEQPFTFTQNDFDLICSNVNAYPVRNAVAAANGFPFLFSPVPLRNFRFPYADESSAACGNREPDWVRASKDYGSYELDRTYERGRIVQGYLPSEKPDSSERRLYLQDGGVTDNLALRGLMNIMGQALGRPIPAGTKGTDKAGGSDTMVSPPAVPPPAVADDSTACRAGLGRVQQILVISVDGQAQPDNDVSTLPYFSDVGRVFSVLLSSIIDSNNFETMFAAHALTRAMAEQLKGLRCSYPTYQGEIVSNFVHISFADLNPDTSKPLAACGRRNAPLRSPPAKGEVRVVVPLKPCTVGEIARSGTSLHFSPAEVEALIDAGHDAFLCSPALRAIFGRADPTAPSLLRTSRGLSAPRIDRCVTRLSIGGNTKSPDGTQHKPMPETRLQDVQ